jgi:hypothetical protein
MSRYRFTVGILSLNFKYIFSLLILLFLAGCTQPDISKNTPSWYLHLKADTDEIIGYGSADTLKAAKSIAREDIAKSLYVDIKSAFKIETKNSTKNVSSSLDEYTDTVLTDAKVLRFEQMDSRFYVALSYENLPLAQKIKKEFAGKKLAGKKLDSMSQDDFFYDAMFSKKLYALFGYIPKYELYFKDGLYYLRISKRSFVLKESDLKYFLFEKNTKKIDIQPSSKHLHVREYFHFKILPKESGFISLLEIDEEGRVIVHIDNLKSEANSSLSYPDLEIYNGLEAGIVGKKESITEAYMAVLCRQRADLSLFEHISSAFNTNDKALRYPELVKVVKGCDFSSVVLHVSR